MYKPQGSIFLFLFWWWWVILHVKQDCEVNLLLYYLLVSAVCSTAESQMFCNYAE